MEINLESVTKMMGELNQKLYGVNPYQTKLKVSCECLTEKEELVAEEERVCWNCGKIDCVCDRDTQEYMDETKLN